MKKLLTLLIATIMLSCAQQEGSTNDLSALGFYGSGEEIIKELAGKKNLSWGEHFLLGQAYNDSKDYKKAILHFANSCFSTHRKIDLTLYAQPVYRFVTGFHFKSPLYDESIYQVARLFYLYNEDKYVVKFVDLLDADETARYRDASILKAKAQERMKNFGDAEKTLLAIENEYSDNPSSQIIRIRLGSVKENNENFSEAVKWYLGVIDIDVSTWQSAIAAMRIRDLMGKKDVSLTSPQQVKIGRALYHGGEYESAVSFLANQGGDVALRYTIRALVRGGKRDDAEKLIRTHKSDRVLHTRLRMTMADELWRRKSRHSAVKVYKSVLKIKNESRKRALRRIAVFLEEGNNADFKKYCTMYVEDYPDDRYSEVLLWLLARDYLAGGNEKKVMAYLEQSLQLFPDGKDADRARYWLEKLYRKNGRKDEALQMERELLAMHPGSSYTWLYMEKAAGRKDTGELKKDFNRAVKMNDSVRGRHAHLMLFFIEKNFESRDQRLKVMETTPWYKPGKRMIDAISKKDTRSDEADHIQSLKDFFSVGYQEGIRRELGILPDTEEVAHDRALMAFHYGKKFNHYSVAAGGLLNLLKVYDLKEDISMLPEKLVTALLPYAFSECVNEASAKFGIDRKMIHAVIKAESMYNPQAVSPAGAVGLMQLMPPTARDIARQMNLKSYRLKDPCTSIRMGAHYLKWLKAYFKNDFEEMVAGYNAGAGNVNRWKSNRTFADDDYFIALLPFDETRGYILRTKKFFLQYDILLNARRLR
ncbi:MAG: transglycosylase SLT domain-containing protein [Spirochaetota bacterium]